MSKKQPSPANKPEPPDHRRTGAAIIAVIALLAGAILILKGQIGEPSAPTKGQVPATATLAAAAGKQPTTLPVQAASPAPTAAVGAEAPEAQLDRLLAAGKPTFAFFHSNNCKQCITMMKLVEEVYPGVADSVALVDVDVYDKRNLALLRRLGIQGIPTQIFFDRAGKSQIVMGVMKPKQLETVLQTLSAGQ